MKARSKKNKSAWLVPVVAETIASLQPITKKLSGINKLDAESYMERFSIAAKRHGFRAKSIGDGRFVYTLGKGPRKISMISGIHGEERSGPVVLLSWLESTKRRKLIPKDVSLMICPLVGHDAWNNNFRFENGKTNLNSVWAKEKAPKYIHDLKRQLRLFKPGVFVDFHEDVTIKDKEPYIFRNGNLSGLVKNLQVYLGVSSKKGLWYPPQYKGTSETFVFENGCLETTTVETPQTMPLRHRVGFNLTLIKWLLENHDNNQ